MTETLAHKAAREERRLQRIEHVRNAAREQIRVGIFTKHRAEPDRTVFPVDVQIRRETGMHDRWHGLDTYRVTYSDGSTRGFDVTYRI
jgi:hypothetical protein